MTDNIDGFYAASRKDWRTWLKANSQKVNSVWLILYNKGSEVPSVNHEEAVEEALCFGWIDSKAVKRDEKSHFQFFAKRNPKSNWSTSNKKRVEDLIAKKKMTKQGMEVIELAKKTGTWNALDDTSMLKMPDDLKVELSRHADASKNFESFPASVKKGILEWILNAKREETRLKRIQETASLAAKNIRANQYPRIKSAE